jgi:3-phosphoshikimate 1-carboxyvinyltransferase
MRKEIRIFVPGSKSLTQRALVLASLAKGRSVLLGPCVCDDTLHLVRALRAMGIIVRMRRGEWEVRSGGALRPPRKRLLLGNAGTAVRFLGALSSIVDGEILLDGSEAMRRRPQGELLAALQKLGVRVCAARGGRLPVSLRGPARRRPAGLDVEAGVSSQHLSGLLMAAPLMPGGLELRLPRAAVSLPYVAMTGALMHLFGVRVERPGRGRLRVRPGAYRPARVRIEVDASGAAMMQAAAALSGRTARIPGAPGKTLQGDAVFPAILGKLASPGPRVLDMKATPDLVPPAVAVALFRGGTTHFANIAHLRAKESDRLAVLAGELRKLGAKIEERKDGLAVRPAALRGGVTLDPHGDHRMAMTFGLVGLRVRGVRIADRACVAKSFPGFFRELGKLR